jgi:Ca-activated chloride channel family protein
MSCSSAAGGFAAQGELRAGLESPYVLASSDGSALVGVVIEPREAAPRRGRVALSLVIDRSGSMAGEKLEHARAAALAALEALADGDEIAVTQFEDHSQLVVPRVRVDARTRTRVREVIARIDSGGGTALFDGVQTGLRALAGVDARALRLILLSDGQATDGPTTADAIVAGLGRTDVTLSTIGVGVDYDEAVLTAIATHGAGQFHHSNDPVQLARLLEDQVKEAHGVVGTGAVVELTCAPSVRSSANGGSDGTIRVNVGELHAGERRTLTVPIRVPLGAAQGAVGKVRLSYRVAESGRTRVSEVDVGYRVSASPLEVERAAVPELMVAADRARVAHALTDAAALLKEGDLIEAQSILRDERARLETRVPKLTGRDRAEAEQLVAMLRDPYIDAPTAGRPATPSSPARDGGHGSGPLAAARFAALVELARQGGALANQELAALDRTQLRVLRNVPYARHGYTFASDDLRTAFARFPWYHADRQFDERRLERVDSDNIALVHAYEGSASLVAARPAAPSTHAASASFDALITRAREGRALGAAELQALDLGQLRVLRNTSYARHGRVFRTRDLQARFRAQPWYHEDAGYDESRLTPADHANVDAVREREQRLLASAGSEGLRDFQLRSVSNAYELARP